MIVALNNVVPCAVDWESGELVCLKYDNQREVSMLTCEVVYRPSACSYALLRFHRPASIVSTPVIVFSVALSLVECRLSWSSMQRDTHCDSVLST